MRVVGDSSTHKKVKYVFHGHSSNQATIYEWCVDRCGSKNKRQNTCVLNEIGLRAHIMLIILDSIVNMIGDWVERGQGYTII